MRFLFAIVCLLCEVVVWADVLPPEVSAMLDKYHVNRDEVSIWVQAVDADQPLVELNGHKQRSPASVAKLLTTSAGLIRLGPDYQWKTRFYVDAPPDEHGVLHGNLYIEGGADPFLIEERLADMVDALQAKGIRHITGNIVLSDGIYHLPLEARDRESFDGNPWAPYNAVPSPLMVNFRTVRVTMSPQGKGLKFELWPNMVNWRIDNKMRINNGACSKNYAPIVDVERDEAGYATLILKGRYSTRCGRREMTVVMGEAVEQFYYLFRDLWYKKGGALDGAGTVGLPPAKKEPFYIGKSLPLVELIAMMNQQSNNVMTRQLLLTLGFEVYGRPGSLQKGRDAVINTLGAFGVDTQGMIIDNGAGLSRVSRVTAGQLVMLLRSLYYSDKKTNFMNSLARAGEVGTLRKRYRGEHLAGHLIGKTGTISGVRAFAGFLQSKSGRDYVVVIIGNGKAALPSLYMQSDLFRWIDK